MYPLERLETFTPYELQLLVCGEQSPEWTRDDILNYTEPKYGYTRDRLVDIEVRSLFEVLLLEIGRCYGADSTPFEMPFRFAEIEFFGFWPKSLDYSKAF